jgi:AbrB family looped-hinge helix DNA binding protein
MLIRISSNGQLTIPKSIRDSLHLKSGDQFLARFQDGKLVLEPVAKGFVQKQHGKYKGHNMLTALEEEHRREIANADEFDSILEKARKQAKEAGIIKADVSKVVAKVRRRK